MGEISVSGSNGSVTVNDWFDTDHGRARKTTGPAAGFAAGMAFTGLYLDLDMDLDRTLVEPSAMKARLIF